MIDWARVSELRDEIGAEGFDEIVELFLMEVEGAVESLEGAPANPVAAEEQMHFLKGAALNLGFSALAEICNKGEKAAKGGDANAVSPGEVRSTFEASKATFLEDLPLRFAA